MTDELRRELIGYYKWVVSLAVFVLTVSLAAVGVFPSALGRSNLLTVGWVLLAICIAFDWMLIKRLISFGIVSAKPPDALSAADRLMLSSMSNVKIYANIQNAAFLVGIALVAMAFLLNWAGPQASS